MDSALDGAMVEVRKVLPELDIVDFDLVGSTYILGAGSDIDVLVQVLDVESAKDELEFAGYTIEGEESYDTSTFYSARKDNLNVLITESSEFFKGFTKAAQLCRFFRVTDKEVRIAIHRHLMDDELLYPRKLVEVPLGL